MHTGQKPRELLNKFIVSSVPRAPTEEHEESEHIEDTAAIADAPRAWWSHRLAGFSCRGVPGTRAPLLNICMGIPTFTSIWRIPVRWFLFVLLLFPAPPPTFFFQLKRTPACEHDGGQRVVFVVRLFFYHCFQSQSPGSRRLILGTGKGRGESRTRGEGTRSETSPRSPPRTPSPRVLIAKLSLGSGKCGPGFRGPLSLGLHSVVELQLTYCACCS